MRRMAYGIRPSLSGTDLLVSHRIRVTFTVADINNLAEDPMDELADEAFDDEGEFQPEQSKRENEGEILPPPFPARLNVTIEKPDNGALLIQAVIQEKYLQIEEISHFPSAEIANAQTAEKDWARQTLYSGPPAENLDPELIDFWGRYLEERGLNIEFQNMVTDYIAFKEQKEYVRWLDSKCRPLSIFEKNTAANNTALDVRKFVAA